MCELWDETFSIKFMESISFIGGGILLNLLWLSYSCRCSVIDHKSPAASQRWFDSGLATITQTHLKKVLICRFSFQFLTWVVAGRSVLCYCCLVDSFSGEIIQVHFLLLPFFSTKKWNCITQNEFIQFMHFAFFYFVVSASVCPPICLQIVISSFISSPNSAVNFITATASFQNVPKFFIFYLITSKLTAFNL